MKFITTFKSGKAMLVSLAIVAGLLALFVALPLVPDAVSVESGASMTANVAEAASYSTSEMVVCSFLKTVGTYCETEQTTTINLPVSGEYSISGLERRGAYDECQVNETFDLYIDGAFIVRSYDPGCENAQDVYNYDYYATDWIAAGSHTVKMVHARQDDDSTPNSVGVTVIFDYDEPEPPSCDAFTATPSSLPVGGGNTTLAWETTKADSVSINQGVGSVSKDGNKSVAVTQTTTYTLTATNDDGTDTCTVTVTVPNEPAPTCDAFTATPSSLPVGGGNVTLAWQTTNAQSVSIDQGVGAVAVDGSMQVAVSQSKTFTLTATGAGGTDTCTANVTVATPQTLTIIADAIVCDSEADLPNYGAGGPNMTNTTAANWVASHQNCELVSGWNFQWGPDDAPKQSGSFVGEAGSPWTTFGPTDGNGRTSVTLDAGDLSGNSHFWLREVLKNGYIPFTESTDNVSAEFYCHTDVLNYDNYDRVDGPALGGTYYCVGWNVATTPEPPAPTCTLDANPNAIQNGASSTLTWTTENATSVSINQGIGSVALDGSKSVAPSQTTTYTLTATGNGGTVTCSDTVTVGTTPPSLSCDSFTTSDGSVSKNETFTLSWQTTGATSVSINQGIGSVSVDGSKSTSITSDTTFTLTASNGQDSVTCDRRVTVKSGGGGSSSPNCELKASKTKIKKGEEITLSWDNDRTDDITLEDSRGTMLVDTEDSEKYDEDKDSIKVKPTQTTTYTLIAYKGSKDDECKVKITVDDVTVTSTRSQVAGISLSTVPYTGFDAGPVLTTIFYILLAAWSVGVAYMLVIRKEPVLGLKLPGMNSTAPLSAKEHLIPKFYANSTLVAPLQKPFAPGNLPVEETPIVGYAALRGDEADVLDDDDAMTALENRAHAANCLLSSDAIRAIMLRADDMHARLGLLDEVIVRAKTEYPSEDGWMVLSGERIDALLGEDEDATMEVSHQETESHDSPVGASSLAEAIVAGNVVSAYQMLDGNPLYALADAVHDLDALYRSRKGESVSVSNMLAQSTFSVTDKQLFAAIDALGGAIDGVYTDEASAVKLAILKAVRALHH